jgi:hypothetical protein
MVPVPGTLPVPADCRRRKSSGNFATLAAMRRASPWLSSLCCENRLLHTKTPSVPGPQKKTNDTGPVATSKGETHNGA